jgi:hypothetical protein
MRKIRRWFGRRRQVIWAEPVLPPFIKVNPMATAIPEDTIQPGDITMGILAREFLEDTSDEEAE